MRKNYHKYRIVLGKQIFDIATVFILVCSAFVAQTVHAFVNTISPQDIIALTNDERTSAGIGALSQDEKLSEAAKQKLADIFERDYFSHNAQDGTTPWYWIARSGYDYTYAGENLAMHFIDAKDQHRAWMRSTTHRQNILNPHYQDIGVAVGGGVVNGVQTTVAVQMFGAKNFSGVVQKGNSLWQTNQPTRLAQASAPFVGGNQKDFREQPVLSEHFLPAVYESLAYFIHPTVSWVAIFVTLLIAVAVDVSIVTKYFDRRDGKTQSA